MNEKQKSLLVTLVSGIALGAAAFVGGCSQEEVIHAAGVGLLLGFLFTF